MPSNCWLLPRLTDFSSESSLVVTTLVSRLRYLINVENRIDHPVRVERIDQCPSSLPRLVAEEPRDHSPGCFDLDRPLERVPIVRHFGHLLDQSEEPIGLQAHVRP